MKQFKGLYLILISMLWISCTDDTVYHSYHHFPKEGWSKSDTIVLDIHITDSLSNNAELSFLLRNQTNYPYQDFNAIVLHNMPDSTEWRSFKVSLFLADNEGRWSGSGWAGLYQSSLSLGNTDVSPGTYTFKVIHQMQDDYLVGIKDIGVLCRLEVSTSASIDSQKDKEEDRKAP